MKRIGWMVLMRNNCLLIRCVAVLLAGCFSVAIAYGQEAPSPEVQAANDVSKLFSETCLHDPGRLDKVIAWAAAKHLPEITDNEARRVFAGAGDGGSAWVLYGKSTNAVLSISWNTDTCAVFGEHADPVAFANWYDTLLNAVAAPPGSNVIRTHEPDNAAHGPLGLRVAKARIIFKDGKTLVMTLLTNQKPGGVYQVSMQISVAHK